MSDAIKAIIVDDEEPAIAKVKSLLGEYPEFSVCGAFTDARDALASAPALRPAVAFLDIAMPGLNGMDAAALFHEKLGNHLLVVFVSAYDEYALPAFAVGAIDYLLKPVGRPRFRNTIQRIKDILARNIRVDALPAEGAPMVRLFGKLEISGVAGFSTTWRTAKVRNLFAFFMHNQDSKIYRDMLLETLWPGTQADKALASLNTCNYYLRRHLDACELPISLEYESGYYWLKMEGFCRDVDLFEKAVEESKAITAENLPPILERLELYRGPYLEDVKSTWASMGREKYSAMYVETRLAIARYYSDRGDHGEVVNNLTKALDCDPLHPGLWRLLFETYELIGDPTRLSRSVETMRRAYLERTGNEPPETLLKR